MLKGMAATVSQPRNLGWEVSKKLRRPEPMCAGSRGRAGGGALTMETEIILLRIFRQIENPRGAV